MKICFWLTGPPFISTSLLRIVDCNDWPHRYTVFEISLIPGFNEEHEL